MPELLLELGTEELPATFVEKAATELLGLVGDGLKSNGLWLSDGAWLATPRRLIVSFQDVKERQEDTEKEQRGPSLKAAYDELGNPTKALLGFCRSQGVEPDGLRKDDQYVWATKRIAGRSAREILSDLLPEAIRKLSFEKSMRWGASRMRFARPIRWILAALDGQAIEFEIEGVLSGLTSRGHRFYSPEPFEAADLAGLVGELRRRKVEPDPAERRQRILSGAVAVAGGMPDLQPALVEENVYLCEWPTAIAGEFRPEFRDLPDRVLVTAMAKHERMFPVWQGSSLTNRFVFVRNSGDDDTVRKGAQWVLNARFNDAKFFFEEDKKLSLDGFLEKTDGIVFQERLGTVRQRADRLARLCVEVARATGASDNEVEYARLAGLYAKADLATGLVSELSSLQGVIGGEYARREGLPDPVCWAISCQYDPSTNTREGAEGRTAARLVMADQLDKLAGYLGLGLLPSGSSDPYGLRRAVTMLIEAAWAWPEPMPSYDALFTSAIAGYEEPTLDEVGARRALYEIFAGRYSALMPNVRYDILDAAIVDPQGPQATEPKAVALRTRVLARFLDDVPFVQTATRPLNIVMAAKRKGIEYGVDDPMARLAHSALESAEGLQLYQLLSEVEAPLDAAVRNENEEEIVRLLKSLSEPIVSFFDNTMVMVDEPEVRYARLTLMHATSLLLLQAGDFSKLVIEG